MRAYAIQQIRLAKPATKQSKITRRQHLIQIYKTTGFKHNDLTEIELPPELLVVWIWYNDVKTSTPLTCQELLAWMEVTGNQLTRFELNLIRALDVTYWKLVTNDNGD